MSLNFFNPGNKSWKMYVNTLTSISGDDILIKPHAGKNVVLEVSGNNNIIFKSGDISYSLDDLIGGGTSDFSASNITTSLIPSNPNSIDLGSSSKYWNKAYITNISASNINVSGTIVLPTTTSIISNNFTVTSTQLGYLSDATRPIQTQINELSSNKANIAGLTFTGIVTISGDISNIRQIIPRVTSDITTSLGSATNIWNRAFIRDLSGITSINGTNWPLTTGGGTSDFSASNITTSLIPRDSSSVDLGTSSKYWRNAYIKNLDDINSITPESGTRVIVVPAVNVGINEMYEDVVNNYRYYAYKNVGSYTFTPQITRTVSVLIVGGGGGGGANLGGGGGGGGVIYIENVSLFSGVSYAITVGNGGPSDTNGNSSSFYGAIANGGGKGGGPYNAAVQGLSGNGHAGGSGGGAASNDIQYEAETTPPLWIGGNSSGNSLGIHTQGSVYGNNGGSIYINRYTSTNPNTLTGRGAGGGGAGGNGGVNGIGSGGAGIMNTMYRGIEHYWGGGGGGALYTFDGTQVSDGSGGIGGGGGGGNWDNYYEAAAGGLGGSSAIYHGSNNNAGGGGAGGQNTGGGGGGGSRYVQLGGNGGSGIVIIREQISINSNIGSSSIGTSTNIWGTAFIHDLSGIASINGTNWPFSGSNITTSLIPSNPDSIDLGTSSKYWNNAYINTISTNNISVSEIANKTILPIWVALGEGGNNIAYSYDGSTNWIGLGTNIFTIGGRGVAYNGTIWVAVGNGTNSIAYSYDGIIWTGIGKNIFTNQGLGIVYNGTMWLALGDGATHCIAYSSNGISWDGIPKSTNTFTEAAYDAAWNGTMWVAVGIGTNSIIYSLNGIAWTPVPNSTITFSVSAHKIAWNGTIWVAVGRGANSIAYSFDGSTNWYGIPNSINTFTTVGLGIAYNGTMWVAVGDGTNSIAYSYDGSTNWVGIPKSANTFTNYGFSVAYNGTMWVALGVGTNTIIYSLNGTTWIPVPNSTNIFSSIGWGLASGYTPKPLGVSSSIIPSKTNTYNLGSTANIWNNAFISHINGTPMSSLTLKEGFFGTIVLVRNTSVNTTGSNFVIKDNNNPANTIAIGLLNSDSPENVIISENSNLRLLRPHHEYNIEYFYSSFYNRSISDISLLIQRGTSRRPTNSNKFYFYPDYNNIYGGVLTLTSIISAFTNTGFYGEVIVENINGGNGGRYLDYKWNRNPDAITPDPIYTSNGIPITSFTRIPANGAGSMIEILEIDRLTNVDTFIQLSINIEPNYLITNVDILGATIQVGSAYPLPSNPGSVGATVMQLKANPNPFTTFKAIRVTYTIQRQSASTGFFGTLTVNNLPGANGGRYLEYQWFVNGSPLNSLTRINTNGAPSSITISEGSRLENMNAQLTLNVTLEANAEITGFSVNNNLVTVVSSSQFQSIFQKIFRANSNNLNNGMIVANYTVNNTYVPQPSNTGFNGSITINHIGQAYSYYLNVLADNSVRYDANEYSSSMTFSIGTQLASPASYLYIIAEPNGSYQRADGGFTNVDITYYGYENGYEKYSIPSYLNNSTIEYEFDSYFND